MWNGTTDKDGRPLRSGRLSRLAALGLTLAAAVSLALMSATSAFAIVGCRSDPVVTLSNGTRVRLETDIQASASQVGNVAYTLHIPQGLSVTDVQFDDGPLAETFSWVADKPPLDPNGNGQVTGQTQVTTTGSSPGPPVQVTLTIETDRGPVEGEWQHNGNVGQWVNQDAQIQSSGNSTCLGDVTLSGSISQGLIVPSGVVCTVNGLTVGQQVQVQPGGSLVATNLTVGQQLQVQSGGSLAATNLQTGQDLQAQQAASVQIHGGSIGGNAQLQGLSSGPTSLCGVSVGHDLNVQNAGSSVGLTLGNPSAGCDGNTVGHNFSAQNNAGTVTASGNTVDGNAQCQGNTWTSATLSGNAVDGNDQGC